MHNHFHLLLEALLEAEEGNKSLATFRDYASADYPEELNPSGVADAGEGERARRAYASLRGKYLSALKMVVSDYLTKLRKYRDAINDARDIMDRYFVDAFVYGMRAQSAKEGSPATFDLAPAHYEWLLRASDEEGSYFSSLMSDVRYKRDLRPDKMDWEQRLVLYANTLDSVFDAGRVAGLALTESTVVYWIVDKEAENCLGCLLLEENSPYTPDNLPCTPRDGSTECLSNCRCSVLVKKVSRSEYARIQASQISKEVMLTQLLARKRTSLGTKRKRSR